MQKEITNDEKMDNDINRKNNNYINNKTTTKTKSIA